MSESRPGATLGIGRWPRECGAPVALRSYRSARYVQTIIRARSPNSGAGCPPSSFPCAERQLTLTAQSLCSQVRAGTSRRSPPIELACKMWARPPGPIAGASRSSREQARVCCLGRNRACCSRHRMLTQATVRPDGGVLHADEAMWEPQWNHAPLVTNRSDFSSGRGVCVVRCVASRPSRAVLTRGERCVLGASHEACVQHACGSEARGGRWRWGTCLVGTGGAAASCPHTAVCAPWVLFQFHLGERGRQEMRRVANCGKQHASSAPRVSRWRGACRVAAAGGRGGRRAAGVYAARSRLSRSRVSLSVSRLDSGTVARLGDSPHSPGHARANFPFFRLYCIVSFIDPRRDDARHTPEASEARASEARTPRDHRAAARGQVERGTHPRLQNAPRDGSLRLPARVL